MSLLADRTGSPGTATSSCTTFSRAARRHSKRVQRARLVVCSSLRPIEPGSRVMKALVSDETASSASRAGASNSTPIQEDLVITRFIAETLLPTRHGNFRLRGYKHSLDGGITFTEPTAIISGQVEGSSNVPVRVHDACFTSEVLGSLKCDCAAQLELALESIQAAGCGMVIYLQQEGRGIGLANKIAAYALQEQGLDTVDANRALGLPDDCREYTSVRNILRDLAVRSVQLMTNNPRKLDVLSQLGVSISGRIPCQVQAGEFNQGYLTAKRERMDHLLDGSWCYWNHDGEPSQPSAAVHSEGGMGLPHGMQQAKGSSSSPALASYTVQMDEDEDGDTSSATSSMSSSSSSSSSQVTVHINGSSSSSSSGSAGGGEA